MSLNKRSFLKLAGAGIAAASIGKSAFASPSSNKNKNSKALSDITKDVKPITTHEKQQRILKAQQLMAKRNISAIVLEPGPAMVYFSGIQWWRSERVTALVIPKEGEVAIVCPFFEEPSIRESLAVGKDVRVWQEHESPFKQIKQVLIDRGVNKGEIAFENSVRYFVLQGVMAELSHMQHTSAEPITRGCRMYKSQHELSLMHKANEITLKAYEHVYHQLEVGMSQNDVKGIMRNAQAALGGSGIWGMALFNEASAYPHGTKQKQVIGEGSTVLMDCGCSVHGYKSDISRTFIVGEASKYQQKIWQTVRQGQTIAFDAAQLGKSAGSVDDQVRKYYESQGLGPQYQLPGLSHRTGHGIGMEGHESVNFVHGEPELLKPGMCFSNEPGIYIPGKFGVRLEDCIYLTENGPKWFTQPPTSIDSPIGKVIAM